MNKLLLKIGLLAGLLVSSNVLAEGAGEATGASTCRSMLPPVAGIFSNANWNNMFPVSIAGVPVGKDGGTTSPWMMYNQTPCFCPTRIGFGVPGPGITLTLFTPNYVAEVEREPGCLNTIGTKIDGLSLMASRSGNSESGEQNSRTKRQVHLMKYPSEWVMEMLSSTGCAHSSSGGIDTTYMTEFDVTWQSDLWAAIFGPEASLFASPIGQMACIPDAITSQIGQPLDPLFWCWGGRGMYPLSGRNNYESDNESANQAILGRFLMRQTRLGIMRLKIGPSAVCSPHPSPVMSKQQYRLDPIHPVPAGWGWPIVPGMHELIWRTIGNFPTHESMTFLVWEAFQCCVIY